MNYEQKYKSALGWMRSIYPTMQGADKEDAEHYFPELKESEDERIRKAIICGMNALKEQHKETFASIPINDCIGWLEKQGEQKPTGSEEDEKMRSAILQDLVNIKTTYPKINLQEEIDWLKSIKPNRWKPSEEQMKALNAINIFGELSYVGQGGTLVKLYNDLKKL